MVEFVGGCLFLFFCCIWEIRGRYWRLLVVLEALGVLVALRVLGRCFFDVLGVLGMLEVL